MNNINSKTIIVFLLLGMNTCRTNRTTSTSELSEEAAVASCYSIESYYVPSGRLEITAGGQSFSLNGSIYIQPDSIFFFRARMLIDVVRGAIYNDSFVVVNYLERTSYRGKNDYLQRITGFPVNPETLLRIFTADKCIENTALHGNRQPFNVDYGEFNQHEQYPLPSILNISAHDGANPIRIRANFQQIALNSLEQVNFNIPSNYRVVVLE